MLYIPISGFTLQINTANGQVASDYYLKFYIANTTTPLSMATDRTGDTLLVKAKIGSKGMPISNPADDSTIFVPHMSIDYRLVIYTSEADADANDTASAYVNIPFMSTRAAASSINGIRNSYNFNNVAGQTVFNAVYDVGFVDVLYNGVEMSPDNYTANDGLTITLNTPVDKADDEINIKAYNYVDFGDASNLPVTATGTATPRTLADWAEKEILSYDSVADAKADTLLEVGRRVKTYGYYTAGDGLGREYTVVLGGTGIEDKYNFINLDNGLQLRLSATNKYVDLSTQTTGYKLAELDISSLGLTPERFAQGVAVNSRSGKIYLYQRTAGSTDKNDERFRIAEFTIGTDGATLVPDSTTADLASGHQGISVEHRSDANPNSVYLWTKAAPHVADTASNEDTGKGCYRWDYQGNLTLASQRLQLFPDNASGSPLAQYYNSTPCISSDQKYLCVKVSSFGTPTSDQRVFIYDLSVINSLSSSAWLDPANFARDSAAYITDWPLSRVQLRSGNFLQEINCDGFFVYATCGGNELTPENKDNVVYTMNGDLVGRYDHTLGDPAESGNPLTPTSWEPEGGSLYYKDGAQLLTLIDTAYDDGGTNRVIHEVWGLRDSALGSKSKAKADLAELGSDIHFSGGVPQEMSFNQGETLAIKVITDNSTGDGYTAFVLQDDGAIELRQPDDITGSRVRRATGAGREILELRGNTGIADGAAVNVYGGSDSVNPGEVHIFTSGDNTTPDLIIDAEGRLIINKKGQIKLANDTGTTNIARSASSGREILEIRANETLGQGAGTNMYGNGDPTNAGSIINTLGTGGNFEIDNLPTSNPAGSGRLWNDSGTLKIT